jgi:hypothetical protein
VVTGKVENTGGGVAWKVSGKQFRGVSSGLFAAYCLLLTAHCLLLTSRRSRLFAARSLLKNEHIALRNKLILFS